MRGPASCKVRGIIPAAPHEAQGIRGILLVGCPVQHARHGPLPSEARVEVHVRNARLTDLDASLRILAQAGELGGTDEADYLRNLLFVPSATVVVAEAQRRIVGMGVLAIRPSVRSGPFVGVIDELGVGHDSELDDADRRLIADHLVEHLATSARNKGCTRVEVAEPLASAEPALWKRVGFASRGRTLSRAIG
jgi:ribosomal protein S18 acetylase RimI-like enzyme